MTYAHNLVLLLITASFLTSACGSLNVQRSLNQGENAEEAGLYYRFWRGNARPNWDHLSADQLKEAKGHDTFSYFVNKWLIPATTSYSAEHTLQAYMPVLPPKDSALHDEVALIVYNDKDSYYALRDGKVGDEATRHEGKKYGPVHGLIFDSGLEDKSLVTSGSLVPEAFPNDWALEVDDDGVAVPKAYDVTASRDNWQSKESRSYFIATFPKKGKIGQDQAEVLKKYFESSRVARVLGKLRHHLVLIDPEYILEYFNFEADNSDVNFNSHVLRSTGRAFDEHFSRYQPKTAGIPQFPAHLRRLSQTDANPLDYEDLDYGQGGTVVFEPGTKPGQVVHPLLDPTIIGM